MMPGYFMALIGERARLGKNRRKNEKNTIAAAIGRSRIFPPMRFEGAILSAHIFFASNEESGFLRKSKSIQGRWRS